MGENKPLPDAAAVSYRQHVHLVLDGALQSAWPSLVCGCDTAKAGIARKEPLGKIVGERLPRTSPPPCMGAQADTQRTQGCRKVLPGICSPARTPGHLGDAERLHMLLSQHIPASLCWAAANKPGTLIKAINFRTQAEMLRKLVCSTPTASARGTPRHAHTPAPAGNTWP